MADKTINDLTATTSLSAGDLLEIENTGNNSRKITAQNAARELNLLAGGWTIIKLTSDYVNATTSYTQITDGTNSFSWTPPANSDIEIEVHALIVSVSTTNLPKIQATIPGAANNTQYGYAEVECIQTSGGKTWNIIGFTTGGTTATFGTGSVPIANVPYPARSVVKLRTGSSPAAITFEAAAESAAANACTIKAGSTMRYRTLA